MTKKNLIILIAGLIIVVAFSASAAILGFKFLKLGQQNAPEQKPALVGIENEITIDSPAPEATISSPLEINGKARGNWYFEASFPVKLFDANGNQIAVMPVRAQSDWMVTDFVPFKATLEFPAPATATGTLVFQNDNPSGDPARSKSFSMPIVFGAVAKTKIEVYFNNLKLDPQVSCNKVFSVDREVGQTQGVARAALEELLKGPTDAEKNDGYYTSINTGVKIQKLTIENGVAKVNFDEQLENAVGGSCRVSAIRAQIVATLKQFSTIKDIIISINGRTADILQP